MTETKRPGKKVLVATNAQGRIVAAAHPAEGGEIQARLIALPGQTLHEIDTPQELAYLESPHAILAALADGHVTAGGILRLRKIRPSEPEKP